MADLFKNFGNRLEELIKKAGLNVNRLAGAVGVRPNTIWNYMDPEIGSFPNSIVLYKLSKELSISMESLLTGEGIDPPQHPDNLIDLNRRREDKDPELKAAIESYIKYWQSGNPLVRELFVMGLKTAEQLLEKTPPTRRGKIEKKGM